MATSLAFETMPGAFLHLFLLGVAMGSVLGTPGGAIGEGVRLMVGGASRSSQDR